MFEPPLCVCKNNLKLNALTFKHTILIKERDLDYALRRRYQQVVERIIALDAADASTQYDYQLTQMTGGQHITMQRLAQVPNY